MTRPGTWIVDGVRRLAGNRRSLALLAIVVVQLAAAVYFLVDGVDDLLAHARDGIDGELMTETLMAAALLGGVVTAINYIVRISRDLQYKEQALARARGALAEHIAMRFAGWRLTPGECDVALFAMKGCDVSEIARMRQAQPGTVRSQLSQIYTKAGVNSQAMLLALFIEDLLE